MGVTRDWSKAEPRRSRGCRVNDRDCDGPIELAHTAGRKYDKPTGERKGPHRVLLVHPMDVVPLCKYHHHAYDRGRLDLLGYLTEEEQSRVVLHLGLLRAWTRLTCEEPQEAPPPKTPLPRRSR